MLRLTEWACAVWQARDTPPAAVCLSLTVTFLERKIRANASRGTSFTDYLSYVLLSEYSGIFSKYDKKLFLWKLPTAALRQRQPYSPSNKPSQNWNHDGTPFKSIASLKKGAEPAEKNTWFICLRVVEQTMTLFLRHITLNMLSPVMTVSLISVENKRLLIRKVLQGHPPGVTVKMHTMLL